MDLSIVIICWNDSKVIANCLQSIYVGTRKTEFEIIVSDNASCDGAVDIIKTRFPQVHVVENGCNLGFAGGNNAGIRHTTGRYVLILNPDTIIQRDALDVMVEFADGHPEAAAFGCRVLNPDGTWQISARPFPSIRGDWIAALYLRPLARLSNRLHSDTYWGWDGTSERNIDWQSGCCVMFRANVLKSLRGFDEQFFYHFEEVDLCRRVWNSGHSIAYTPHACIIHLGSQSVNRFPVRFELEKYRNRYRYYYKHFGPAGARQCRRAVLAWLWFRQFAYGLIRILFPGRVPKERIDMYRISRHWNWSLDPVDFVTTGKEPQLSVQ